MKRFATTLAVIAFACSAFAGLTYKVQSSTNGLRNVTIAGNVAVDGSHVRMDVTSGDNLLFKDNSVVLSSDGGKTMTVLDPSTKNYYELQLDQVIGGSASMLKNINEMIDVSFNNPRVAVRDEGEGGIVEGFPTHKYVLEASYDVAINAMGQKMTTHMKMTTESWTTTQFASEFASFLQTRGFKTGVEALDKLIDAQSTGMKGFPLKSISTVAVNQGEKDMTMVTTALVTNIEKKSVDASRFAMPAGYTKVDDPISRMMKQIKQ